MLSGLLFFFTEKEIVMKVTVDEYLGFLVEQCHIKMSCMCKVAETKHTYVHQDTFRLLKPDLNVKVRLYTYANICILILEI